MANHGYVKTRKTMTPAQITTMLEDLNTKLFKGVIRIAYSKDPGDGSHWGPHTWQLEYVSGDTRWVSRVCWLNSRRSFEMRHGGGSRLAWWIDTAICNEVAVRFNGTISDDGVDEKLAGVPDKFNKFSDYMDMVMQHCKDPALRAEILKCEMSMVPPEFDLTQKAEGENAVIPDTASP